jgi:D-glycero-D-manno-heptose 1,7-bisphosphate phosphatase
MKRALFLDRDGVINVDVGYLHRPEDCVFIPGIFDLVRSVRQRDYEVFIVTNQAGIGRGYYSEQTFVDFTAWMLSQFMLERAPITAVYHCPHHPTAGIGEYHRECECRKPAPGMLLRAAREHEIDLKGSIMVGDTLTDMQAAKSAGIGRRYLLGDFDDGDIDPDVNRVKSLREIVNNI